MWGTPTTYLSPKFGIVYVKVCARHNTVGTWLHVSASFELIRTTTRFIIVWAKKSERRLQQRIYFAKIVYDMHLTSVHKIVIQPDDCKKLAETKQEDNGLMQTTSMVKSNEIPVKQTTKLQDKQQEKKQHKCSICSY